jgi:hypothetical protein
MRAVARLCTSNSAAERELRLAPQALSHDSSPLQTLRRPDGGEVIEFWHGLGAQKKSAPPKRGRRSASPKGTNGKLADLRGCGGSRAAALTSPKFLDEGG